MPKNLFFETKPGLVVHEWTKNVRGTVLYQPADAEPPGHERSAWMRRLLPEVGPGALPVDVRPSAGQSAIETLSRRRSIRQYAAEPIDFDDLAQLLTLSYPPAAPGATPNPAQHGRLRPWREQVGDCKLFPLVLHVAGLEPGGYMYDEVSRQLLPIRIEDPMPLVRSECFQAEFSTASVLMLVVGSLADNLTRYGDRGYRYMLLDTGVMLQRLYLAVSALGLSGSATGSIVHDGFSAWLGLDGYNATVLMGFAIGRALGGPQE